MTPIIHFREICLELSALTLSTVKDSTDMQCLPEAGHLKEVL